MKTTKNAPNQPNQEEWTLQFYNVPPTEQAEILHIFSPVVKSGKKIEKNILDE